jgi:hypothetical protein
LSRFGFSTYYFSELDFRSSLSIRGGFLEFPSMNDTIFMRRREAGQYLRDKYGFGSSATLAKLATLGGGPTFRKCGPIVLYARDDLDNWATGKISSPLRSTSDQSHAA